MQPRRYRIVYEQTSHLQSTQSSSDDTGMYYLSIDIMTFDYLRCDISSCDMRAPL